MAIIHYSSIASVHTHTHVNTAAVFGNCIGKSCQFVSGNVFFSVVRWQTSLESGRVARTALMLGDLDCGRQSTPNYVISPSAVS